MPPSFEVRTPEQVITSPIEIVDSIPLNISNAIMRGLDYSCHNRTQYIRDLISDLYSKNNQQYVLQEKRDNQENNEYSFSEQTIQIDTIKNVIKKSDTGEIKMAKKNKKRIPIWLIAILITLPIMLGLFLIIYKDMFGEIPIGNSSDSSSVSSLNSEFIVPSSNVQEESSKAETSSEILTNSVVVDDFVNKLYEDINTSTAYQDMLSFIVTEEFSETVPVGMIFGQSIEKGSIVEQGSSIELKVSKGSQYVLIPPITDENGEKIKLEDYVTYLNDNGLEYEIVKMENGSYLKDEIISLNITEGEYVDRAVTTSVTIYVAE
ncbi:MAG: PASTA domain-containing protein, partial [Oscillospiraceae bacterium]